MPARPPQMYKRPPAFCAAFPLLRPSISLRFGTDGKVRGLFFLLSTPPQTFDRFSFYIFMADFTLFFLSFLPPPPKKNHPFLLPPAPFVSPDSRVIVGHARDGPAYLGTAVLPEASLFPFHCDWLPKEKRDTCFLARRVSAAFVINTVPRSPSTVGLFFPLAGCLFEYMKED